MISKNKISLIDNIFRKMKLFLKIYVEVAKEKRKGLL